MTIDELRHDIALLSLTRIKDNDKWPYLRVAAEGFSLDDKDIQIMLEEGKKGAFLPAALKPEWRKLQGRIFEEYMALKLKENHNFIRWSNDKCAPGIVDPTCQEPDLLYRRKDDQHQVFAVECKWHEEEGELLRLTSYAKQLDNYKAFQEQRDIPVFMAYGIGDTGDDIRAVYIAPLDFILEKRSNKTNILMSEMVPFKVGDIMCLRFEDGRLA